MKDAEGKEIKIGDEIIAAHNCGNSSCRPCRYTVVGFTPKMVKVEEKDVGYTNIHPHICVII